ncbi:DNA adenine methylase [Leptolyngbya sp. FACHB-36]|uniref:DNA adenine methylase n=1 Tax=Leptolyngbya sp. FACHB-36 TaxID=2692808 RepID=UPI0016807B77|nr:DNA adenine methylase [Leptolyngbya sp. FACHB-36]MBD2021526.1 DNA adenine methylase [Leptolyngbya sp. FACHB-36]
MQTQLARSIYPRPFLKWAGGKGQLLQQYIPFFPKQFSTYYEPFLGGGAVFFHLLPRQAFLMDINPELVNVFCCVRDCVEDLIEQLREHRDRHSPDYYYTVRATSHGTSVERAARLIYLNKTCFNGLYRENTKGQFNVPIGRYKNPAICDAALLGAVSVALRSARIEQCRFDTVMDYATEQDFVYFDPPYHPISATSKFTAYNRDSFTQADQLRLRDVVVALAERGVKVMLSNSDCPFVRDLYQGFTIHTIVAARSINSNAAKRGKITEVLVTTY